MCVRMCVTRTTAYITFFTMADELFVQSVTWGEVVALFAFGGVIIEHCIECGMPLMVSQVADWVTVYTQDRVASWIAINGGWKGLVDFHQKYYQVELSGSSMTCVIISIVICLFIPPIFYYQ